MKSLAFLSVFTTLLSVVFIASLTDAKNSKVFGNSRFISFDSKGGNIDIDLDLSLPFLSIPLNSEMSPDGSPASLLNVNTKGITVAGFMIAIATFVVPLLFKSPPDHHYRLENEFNFWDMGNSMNNLLLGNNRVAPCIQRSVCTVVARVAKSGHSTSNDKIIDGITSHAWFENVTNGTGIQEAVAIGRKDNSDCSAIYKGCFMPAKFFDNILDRYGGF